MSMTLCVSSIIVKRVKRVKRVNYRLFTVLTLSIVIA